MYLKEEVQVDTANGNSANGNISKQPYTKL
jgi:hypothetical protein